MVKKHVVSKASRGTSGFTLVEVLIVVVILGIMAAIVVPQFLSAADDSRESAIKANLHRTRTQLEIYKEDHLNLYPTLAGIADQMTLASKPDGSTAPKGTPGFDFGPYLQTFPNNPSTNTNTVANGAVGTSAWYYDETTGDFHANDSAGSRAW